MKIARRVHQKSVWFMALEIIMMNVSSWANLELSKLQTSLLRTAEEILYLVKISWKNKRTTLLLTIWRMNSAWLNTKNYVPSIMDHYNVWKLITVKTTCIRWEIWVLTRLKRKSNNLSVRLNTKDHMWLKIEMKWYICMITK